MNGITHKELQILLNALSLLIEQEQDTKDYTELIEKLHKLEQHERQKMYEGLK